MKINQNKFHNVKIVVYICKIFNYNKIHMSKKKLNLSQNMLDNIGKKHNIIIIEDSDNYPCQFEIGDFVINGHGEAGFIKNDYDLNRDARVNVGGTIQVSSTGSNGYDTLEINGFHVFKINTSDDF